MVVLWLTVYLAVLVWSAINPADYFTWLLEVLPALIGLLVLALTFNRFRLTALVYVLILLHCIILMVGAHFTYAEVPLFDWFKDLFELERNNYDKLGHLAQGFVPAMIAREVLLRFNIIQNRAWLNFFIVCFCLALSALYEILEWLVAAATGDSAEAFLGTQGYVWDTQSDMLLALIGASVALLSCSRWHDNQLHSLKGEGRR